MTFYVIQSNQSLDGWSISSQAVYKSKHYLIVLKQYPLLQQLSNVFDQIASKWNTSQIWPFQSLKITSRTI